MKNNFLSVLFTLALTGVLMVPAAAQATPEQAGDCVRCTILGLWNQNCEQHEAGHVCVKPSCPSIPCKPCDPPTEEPEIPDVPEVPEVPEIPEIPEQPDVPEVPEQPDEPEVPDVPSQPDNGGSVSGFEQQVVDLVNRERAANGLKPLVISAKLSNGARAKSQDMSDNNYFDHNSPTYGSPFDMMRSFGITYSSAGENIAMGQTTPEAVMNAWMNSAGHRANILSEKFTTIGVGYVSSGNYWTQWFIS